MAHQQGLSQLTQWKIQGRLGFKSADKKQSASFNWQQNKQEYKLNLTSVIGTSLLKMSGDRDSVTLEVDDETYQDNDPSFLIWRITGWQIPVEQFPFWVKGQHQEQAEVTTSQQGWVTQIKPNCNNCDNWLINYDNYKLVKNNWLPHNIVLNNTSNNSQLLIRVNAWR